MHIRSRPWVFLVGLVPVSATWGQQVASSGGEDSAVALGEIVVTAQRRGENLQSVPISVTAVSGAELQAAGVSNTEALGMVTPGLSIQETSGALQPHIRSVGTNENGPGVESPVATYVDGVYYANASSAMLSLNDVERVEVLKGPQGTLFGRNTTGGLIQIISKDPVFDLTGNAQVSYGNYQDVVGNFYVADGLTDKLASSVSVHYEHQGEGYGRNIFNGEGVDRMIYDEAIRNKYLFEPTDATHLRLTLDFEQRSSNFLTQQPLNEGVSGAANPIVFNNAAFGGPFNYGGPYDINYGVQPRAVVQNGGAALNFRQDLGPVSLTSISAYRDSNYKYSFSIDYTPITATALGLYQKDSQFSQEFQLASGQTSSLVWAAGFYYFWARDGWDPLGVFLNGPSAAPLPAIDIAIRDQQQTNSYAAYAQATYEIVKDTDLTLGARYTYEVKDFEGTTTTSFPGVPIPTTLVGIPGGAYPAHLREDRPSYRVSLDHKFTPELMAYASFNTGFKSGGFNVSVPGATPFSPETLKAWELGAKTEWLDHRLRVNASAFHYDYTDIQIGYFVLGSEAFKNGAKAKIYGTDLDAEAVLAKGLTVSGGMEWMHAAFLSFPDAPVALPGVSCTTTSDAPLCEGSAAGNKLPYSPDATFNLGANYGRSLLDGKIALDVRFFFSSRWFASPDNTVEQSPYHLLNASLFWTDADNRWSFGVWGKNLTNAFYAVSALEAPQGDSHTLGAPRTYGATVSYHFGK